MALFSKVGSILRQSAAKNLNPEMSASCPSMYQAIRSMSSSKLFIGGLSYTTDDQSLREAFGSYGEVVVARVIMDRETGRSRGFGFITYTSSEEASSAIQALDGQDLHGRRVRVDYATERARGGGFGGGGGPGGYGGGGGNYGGGNYGGGGGGYNNGGSYGGTGAGGGYSGNYPSGGGGGGVYSGGNNFDSGNATYGSGGGNNFDSGSGAFGSSSGGDSGVPSGAVSSDSYVSGSANNGFANVNQFDTAGSGAIADVAEGGFNQSNPVEVNYRDDDNEPDNIAKNV